MSASLSVFASVSRPNAPAWQPANAPETINAMFFVTADAGPGIAPRLVEPFAKHALVPARVHISSEDGAGEDISADLRVRDVSRKTAQTIEKALRAIIGVRQVITLAE